MIKKLLLIVLLASSGCKQKVNESKSSFSLDQNNGPSIVRVEGRRLLVDDNNYMINGVCWNPVPRNGGGNRDAIFRHFDNHKEQVEQDIQLMKDAGINTVRTYIPIEDVRVLNLLHDAGIKVIVPFFADTNEQRIKEVVNKVKDHPSTLMYEVGNEWNYNKLYKDILTPFEAESKIKTTAYFIKQVDSNHPVSSSHGDVPPADLMNRLTLIDLWGLNIYSGKTFGKTFEKIKNRTSKPIYMSEFGADNFNAKESRPDLKAVATALTDLIGEIRKNSSYTGGVAVGGTVFEWSDEWWKAGNNNQQDQGGIAPGGGPYPDSIFNEEYWGIVDIDRKIRPAYETIKRLYGGSGSTVPSQAMPQIDEVRLDKWHPSCTERMKNQLPYKTKHEIAGMKNDPSIYNNQSWMDCINHFETNTPQDSQSKWHPSCTEKMRNQLPYKTKHEITGMKNDPSIYNNQSWMDCINQFERFQP